MKYKPDFLQIPYLLFQDKNLQALDLKVFAIIYYFTKMKGQRCTASNKKIAEFAYSTPSSVANSISRLDKNGYIKRTFKDKNKRSRKEIIPLVETSKASLTDERGFTHRCNEVSPTDEQIRKRDKEKNTLQKQVLREIPFNCSEEIEKLLKDKQDHIVIIGFYMKQRKMKIPSKFAFSQELKRNLRPARELSEYKKEKINAAFIKAKNRTKEYTLETVIKYLHK